MANRAVKESPNVLITDEALYFFPSGIFFGMLINHGIKCLKPQYRNIGRYDSLQQLGFLYHEYEGDIADLFCMPIDVSLNQMIKNCMQTDARNTILNGGIAGVSVTVIGDETINYQSLNGERRIGVKSEITAEMVLNIEDHYGEGAFGVIVCTVPQMMKIAPGLTDRNFMFPKIGPYFKNDGIAPRYSLLKKEYDDEVVSWKVTHSHDVVGFEPFSSVAAAAMAMG